jgi:hypothetical protein
MGHRIAARCGGPVLQKHISGRKYPGYHEHLEEIVNVFHLLECSCRYETFDECETISHGHAAKVTKVGIDSQLRNVGSILGRMAYPTISHPQFENSGPSLIALSDPLAVATLRRPLGLDF